MGVIVGINKMDCDVASYKESRYTEIKDEMVNTMKKVGWKADFLETCVPFLPLSGWIGDNLIEKSTNMDWWKGADVKGAKGDKVHVDTLKDCLNDMIAPPARDTEKTLRLPISGIYKIKGVVDFTAMLQTLEIPGELKRGYSPIGFVRTGRAACKLSDIAWKKGKETGGKKAEGVHSLKSNEMAQCSFEP